MTEAIHDQNIQVDVPTWAAQLYTLLATHLQKGLYQVI